MEGNSLISFYQEPSFWINLFVGLISVFFSLIAYLEAKKAKIAAREAGKVVKIQTITIELTEIIQRLDKLDIDINYQSAWDFCAEINRKVRRILASYRHDSEIESIEIITCLNNLKSCLEGVKPFSYDSQADDSLKNTVYYAIESELSTLSGKLAELTGLLEQKI